MCTNYHKSVIRCCRPKDSPPVWDCNGPCRQKRGPDSSTHRAPCNSCKMQTVSSLKLITFGLLVGVQAAHGLSRQYLSMGNCRICQWVAICAQAGHGSSQCLPMDCHRLPMGSLWSYLWAMCQLPIGDAAADCGWSVSNLGINMFFSTHLRSAFMKGRRFKRDTK